jgi:hypothetical protein
VTTAVLDACVLYSAPLRDLFMYLAVHFVFQPKWTARIHKEWMESVLERRPDLGRAALERTRDLMNRWARDWQVPDHEAFIPALALPDPEDRHVLAAAIAAKVPVIVTFNRRDFPDEALAPHGVRALHPDDFACGLLDETPETFLLAVRTHRAALQNPSMSAEQYLATLSRCGLPQTAARLAALGEPIQQS